MKPSAVIMMHREAGVVTLRPRFNNKLGMFELVKSTLTGGWAVYGGRKFYTKEEAAKNAAQLAEMMPKHYRLDDQATEYVPQKSYRDAQV